MGDDARRGRVYLPLDEMQQFGVKVADVLQRHAPSDGFVPMMRFQAERARARLRRSAGAAAGGRPQGPAHRIDHGRDLLDSARRDRARRLPVLHQRIALTPLRKLWIAWKHLGLGVNAPRLRVGVIGGGWAGCAAAAACARAGHQPILLEASGELGGRARRLALELDGAFVTRSTTASTCWSVRIPPYAKLCSSVRRRARHGLRCAVRSKSPIRTACRLHAARLPAPWHLAAALLAARGLGLSDRSALIGLLRRLKKSRWNVGHDRSITQWLHECGQTSQVVRRVWRPLALAALNTPLDRASAQIFASVLRDSLGAAGSASEMWLPRADLSALFPDAVERYVVAQGGQVRRDARVERVDRSERRRGFRLKLRNGPERTVAVDAVVYAAAPAHLEHIMGRSERLSATYEALSRFEHEPIYTVYLKYAPAVGIARGFSALLDDAPKRRYAQWVFDRGALDRSNQGVLAAVISSSGPHEAEPLEDVCQAVAQQLTDDLGLPAPVDARAIADRRATLAAVPHLRRPPNRTLSPGFAIAGDWTESDYPSTLETAVRSGRAAARALLA